MIAINLKQTDLHAQKLNNTFSLFIIDTLQFKISVILLVVNSDAILAAFD